MTARQHKHAVGILSVEFLTYTITLYVVRYRDSAVRQYVQSSINPQNEL